jgi:excisionase family DNA binding protein
MSPPRARRTRQPTAALFVRIPTEQAERLDRAAFALGRPKQELIASLLEHHVDPDSPDGLAALGDGGPGGRRTPDTVVPAGSDLVLGHHAFRATGPRERTPEVLTLDQAAELLQVEADVLAAMAERGQLPARRLGEHWRLSRRALVDWLAASDSPADPTRPDSAPEGESGTAPPDR